MTAHLPIPVSTYTVTWLSFTCAALVCVPRQGLRACPQVSRWWQSGISPVFADLWVLRQFPHFQVLQLQLAVLGMLSHLLGLWARLLESSAYGNPWIRGTTCPPPVQPADLGSPVCSGQVLSKCRPSERSGECGVRYLLLGKNLLCAEPVLYAGISQVTSNSSTITPISPTEETKPPGGSVTH